MLRQREDDWSLPKSYIKVSFRLLRPSYLPRQISVREIFLPNYLNVLKSDIDKMPSPQCGLACVCACPVQVSLLYVGYKLPPR